MYEIKHPDHITNTLNILYFSWVGALKTVFKEEFQVAVDNPSSKISPTFYSWPKCFL